MKNILSFIICSILLLPLCKGQVLDVINLNCNDTISVTISGLGNTQCVVAMSYGLAKLELQKIILAAMDSSLNCSSEDCPLPKPFFHPPKCFPRVFDELPIPTITTTGGESLKFCFTFSDTDFRVGCSDCESLRIIPGEY